MAGSVYSKLREQVFQAAFVEKRDCLLFCPLSPESAVRQGCKHSCFGRCPGPLFVSPPPGVALPHPRPKSADTYILGSWLPPTGLLAFSCPSQTHPKKSLAFVVLLTSAWSHKSCRAKRNRFVLNNNNNYPLSLLPAHLR